MTTEFQDRLVRVALRREFLTEAQVREALAQWSLARAEGRRVALHRVLLESGLLSRDQLLAVRRDMAREGIHLRLDDFDVLARIGRDAMGTLYRARQRSLDRIVALRLLATDLAANEEFVQRFKREARLAARITHPNVVQVYDTAQARGTHYLVMEYVEGQNLNHFFSAERPLPEKQALEIGIQVARALEAAAARDVVHRHINPADIIITDKETAKLANLGVAPASAEDTQGSAASPLYMSPEQIRKEPLDARTDIYSLGCVLYHAVTGRPPFEGKDAAETIRLHETQPPDARKLRPELSKPFAALLKRMMAKRPQDRPASATVLLAEMERVQDGGDAVPPHRPPRWLWWFAYILAAIAIILLTLSIITAMRSGQSGRSGVESREF